MSDAMYVIIQELRAENAKLRDAMKKARWIARGNG